MNGIYLHNYFDVRKIAGIIIWRITIRNVK